MAIFPLAPLTLKNTASVGQQTRTFFNTAVTVTQDLTSTNCSIDNKRVQFCVT